jgi:hypothetical protein
MAHLDSVQDRWINVQSHASDKVTSIGSIRKKTI